MISNNKYYFLSPLEIVKDVTKEILRRNLNYINKIKLCGVGGQHYLVLNKISTL